MINYMTNKEYNNEKNIKLFIITSNNIPLIATKESDGTPIKETYNLNYYKDNYPCTNHIDYLQVLLNKYYKNTLLEKYIGIIDNNKTAEIIQELIKENNIVLSNITLYDGISYQINKELTARLYINKFATNEQLAILNDNNNILAQFNYIEIYNYNNKLEKLDIIINKNKVKQKRLVKN